MNEPNAVPSLSVYQLRIVLRGISPLVWRRLLVPAEATLTDLHEALRTSFGWSGESFHRFLVHGHEYAADHRSWSSHDARAVGLGDLGLRVGERFVYEYDFGDGWVHDVRVERFAEAEPGKRYPRCTAGRRAAPPEGCGGAWAYLAWEDEVRSRLVWTLGDPSELEDHELVELCRWLVRDRFDRRAVHRRLARSGGGGS
jgi:hypothetical protein